MDSVQGLSDIAVVGSLLSVGVFLIITIISLALIKHLQKPSPWENTTKQEPFKCGYCPINGEKPNGQSKRTRTRE